jgi:hypothetical protein
MLQAKEARRSLLFIIVIGLVILFSTGLAGPPRLPEEPIIIP